MKRHRSMTRLGATRARSLAMVAGAVAVTILLSACVSDDLAQQYRAGSSKGYISGNGAVTEFSEANRQAPVDFSGTLESGATTTSEDYRGRVLVVNFWYAGCPPCRAEAGDLQAVWTKYRDQGVGFVGVNIRDQNVATARAFENTFGVTYPSVMDARSGTMTLAFSGVVGPNAVPTTLVIDKKGRLSARILGQISDASTLEALVRTALAEGGQ